MKIYKLLFAAGLLAFTTVGKAQDKTQFSLLEAEAYAAENNLQVTNALLDYEAARKKVWETTAIGLPQVNIEGQFQQLLDIPVSVVDAQLFNPMAPAGEVLEFRMGQEFTTSASLTLSQLIFDGSYLVALKFSKFYKEMATTSIDLKKAEVKAMVRQAYYNVLVAAESIRLTDSIVQTTQELRNQISTFQETGLIQQEEVQQIDLALNQALSSKTSAERQYFVAMNLLKMTMGYDLDKELEVTENIVDVLVEVLGTSDAGSGTVQNNAAYVMMNQQVTLDGFSIKNEKAQMLPSLGGFFTHSQNAFRNEFNFFADQPWYPTTIWGISLKVPVTSSGMKIARVKQAEIKMEQDQNSLKNIENSLTFQEIQLKASYNEAIDQMELSKANVDLARTLYRNQLSRQKNGMAGALQVTQLQQQLLTAEANYIGSIMQLLNAKVELDKLYNK